ncbi:MAG: hypothetical protein LBG97_06535 [Coriobacteriales bacterium]|nr:hypothetical protein [Coriobacteriales bacterium]
MLAGVLALGACSNPDSGSNANLDTSSNYSVNTNSDSSKTQTTIVNVASRYDSVEVWDAVNKLLEADNIKVVNKAYDAAVNLNDLLIAGDVDLNVAQHYAAIDYFKSADKKYDVLVPLGDIHISTIDLYSNKYKDVNELPNGANIAIPNDAMNGGRALMVLAKADLITLDSNYVGFPDETNITANPKNFHFVKIDSSSMIRVLDDVDAGFAYSLNAVDANLNPIIDPILNDKLDLQNDATQKQFVIVFTGVNGDEKNEVYQKVVKAFHNDEVYKVYKEVYKGGNIPVADGKPIDLSKF